MPPLLPLLLLGLCLGSYWWFLRGDLGDYTRFKALSGSRARRARYRRWLIKATLAFALPSLAALALLGRSGALLTLPPEFAPLAALMTRAGINGTALVGATFGGLAVGIAAAILLGLARRDRAGSPRGLLGDVGPLLPRNRAEISDGAVLSVAAGLTEELFFRLCLPLLVTLVTGVPVLGIAVGVVLFAAAHLYQGWTGVAATGVLGLLFSVLYLATGSLLVAMAVHAVIDLNGLVLRPILAGAWRVRD